LPFIFSENGDALRAVRSARRGGAQDERLAFPRDGLTIFFLSNRSRCALLCLSPYCAVGRLLSGTARARGTAGEASISYGHIVIRKVPSSSLSKGFDFSLLTALVIPEKRNLKYFGRFHLQCIFGTGIPADRPYHSFSLNLSAGYNKHSVASASIHRSGIFRRGEPR